MPISASISFYIEHYFQDETDIDYDIPAPKNTKSDNHDYEEYDDPQPVVPGDDDDVETDLDYDNPVQFVIHKSSFRWNEF